MSKAHVSEASTYDLFNFPITKGLIQKNIDDFYHRAWVIKN